MGICFVGKKRSFRDFLGRKARFARKKNWFNARKTYRVQTRHGAGQFIKTEPGEILTLDGRRVGEFLSPVFRFLGLFVSAPRRGDVNGLLLARKFEGEHDGAALYTEGQCARLAIGTSKWFIAGKDVKRNRLFVAPKGHESLEVTEFYTKNVCWSCSKEGKPADEALESANGCSQNDRLHVQFRNATDAGENMKDPSPLSSPSPCRAFPVERFGFRISADALHAAVPCSINRR
ncbi:MAG: hypothetical protein BJ554DRAFT_3666 [Olpidium bornovanus]|uniref:Uncharacterized protein n=1 Tax=Olpidium bornovanus TaxID=278681 RepID=A0A8H8DG32_9FUNG|nr:MAG: hypothetical protein BJ554DRAFT_3666 [Olpidium bornovanus]